MPRGGATYYAHWSVSNGWSGTSYCNGGSKKTSAYVAENLDNTHYFWINASGTRSSVRYAWYKGSKGWWFHNVNDEAAYEKSVTRAICKRNSNSSLTCKNYSFDSSGWCSSDNYACN